MFQVGGVKIHGLEAIYQETGRRAAEALMESG
jgi:hypothetical protein